MSARDPQCPLCQSTGGELLWQGQHLRIIDAQEADYPGFTRVVWNAHLPEMTSLSTHGRDLIMRAVYAIEQAQRDTLHPDKVNLAALGNMVPHLHWHVIPRWHEDRHFPSPIWAPPRFAAGQEPAEFFTRQQDLQARLHRYRDRVTEVMNALLWH